jgi:hypothetical protein
VKPTLVESDFEEAAGALGCDVAAIKAVAEVESAGGGFNADDSLKILFEGHIFHKYTQGRFDVAHPTLSYPVWTRVHYGKDQFAEHCRLKAAVELDPVAALMSTSFGKFQIMGFNFPMCGFASVDEFVHSLSLGEHEHLAAFVEFIEHRGMADELREHRWADFARLYNGPRFAENAYHTKMEAAFRKFSPR